MEETCTDGPEHRWTSVELLLADGTTLVVGRVPVASRVDLGTVEGLARLQVGARRRGCRLTLRHPPGVACPLARLLDLVGLTAEVGDVVAQARTFLAARPAGDGARSAGEGGPPP